jgi:hypothetical protein
MNKKSPISSFLNYKSSQNQNKNDESRLSSNRSKLGVNIPKGITSDTKSGMSDLLDKINNEKLKDIIEFKNINYKAINIIEGTLEIFDDKVTNTLDEGETYELVESEVLTQQRKDNEEWKNKKIDLIDVYNELVNSCNNTTKDLLTNKTDYNTHEEQKLKHSNELYEKTDRLKEIYLQSHKLMDMISKESNEKDNILRALIRLVNNTGFKPTKELKELYTKFNNEYYGFSSKPDKSQKYMETLKENITKLEKDLEKKNKELEKVKAILNIND